MDATIRHLLDTLDEDADPNEISDEEYLTAVRESDEARERFRATLSAEQWHLYLDADDADNAVDYFVSMHAQERAFLLGIRWGSKAAQA